VDAADAALTEIEWSSPIFMSRLADLVENKNLTKFKIKKLITTGIIELLGRRRRKKK
jgi:hypothetical protein